MAQEISEQTSKQPVQSDSGSDPEEINQEPEVTSNKESSSSTAEIKNDNIEPGEVVTVFLEPCPENGKKGNSGTSKLQVAMTPQAAKAVASESGKINTPRKRKLVSLFTLYLGRYGPGGGRRGVVLVI